MPAVRPPRPGRSPRPPAPTPVRRPPSAPLSRPQPMARPDPAPPTPTPGGFRWAYAVTTHPSRRDGLLPRTLRSLAAGGFDRPWLAVDGAGPGDAARYGGEFGSAVAGLTVRGPTPVRTAGHWLLTLLELYCRDPAADRYAVFQDDLVTVRGLRRFLDRAAALPADALPNADGLYPADPGRVYWNLLTFPSNQAVCPPVPDPAGGNEAATLTSATVSSDASAWLVIGAGTTLTTITQNGGTVQLRAAATTVTHNAGDMSRSGAGAVGTWTDGGGRAYDYGTGTVTAFTAAGSYSYVGASGCTVTTLTGKPGGKFLDRSGRVTVTDAVVLDRCHLPGPPGDVGPAPFYLSVGTGRGVTVAAP